MITTHTHKKLVWMDAESPNNEEISSLVNRFGLNPLVGEELKDSPSLAKIDFYKDYMLIVLTLPVRINTKGAHEIVDREIDFVIGIDFLITSRTDTIEQIEYFSKIFDAHTILEKNEEIVNAGHLFYYIIKRIYAGMINDLENIKDALGEAENRIFKGDERQMVEVLSGLNRELIDFKQTARIHKDIWDGMDEHAEKEMFGKDFSEYIKDIRLDFEHIHEIVANAH